MKGIKHDQDKPRWSLLPFGAVNEIVRVLTFGARKYSDGNWVMVSADRYKSAMFRHLAAWMDGERCDKETGISHLGHAGCCLLFLLRKELDTWGDLDSEANKKWGKRRKWS